VFVADAVAYSASKGALITFTKDLAAKWAKHNIRVNAIAPGFIDTDMTRRLPENLKQEILKN
jgi:gluconate 5-dehydrogenase